MFSKLHTRFDDCDKAGCASSPTPAEDDDAELLEMLNNFDNKELSELCFHMPENTFPRHKCVRFLRWIQSLEQPLAPDMFLPNSIYRQRFLELDKSDDEGEARGGRKFSLPYWLRRQLRQPSPRVGSVFDYDDNEADNRALDDNDDKSDVEIVVEDESAQDVVDVYMPRTVPTPEQLLRPDSTKLLPGSIPILNIAEIQDFNLEMLSSSTAELSAKVRKKGAKKSNKKADVKKEGKRKKTKSQKSKVTKLPVVKAQEPAEVPVHNLTPISRKSQRDDSAKIMQFPVRLYETRKKSLRRNILENELPHVLQNLGSVTGTIDQALMGLLDASEEAVFEDKDSLVEPLSPSGNIPSQIADDATYTARAQQGSRLSGFEEETVFLGEKIARVLSSRIAITRKVHEDYSKQKIEDEEDDDNDDDSDGDEIFDDDDEHPSEMTKALVAAYAGDDDEIPISKRKYKEPEELPPIEPSTSKPRVELPGRKENLSENLASLPTIWQRQREVDKKRGASMTYKLLPRNFRNGVKAVEDIRNVSQSLPKPQSSHKERAENNSEAATDKYTRRLSLPLIPTESKFNKESSYLPSISVSPQQFKLPTILQSEQEVSVPPEDSTDSQVGTDTGITDVKEDSSTIDDAVIEKTKQSTNETFLKDNRQQTEPDVNESGEKSASEEYVSSAPEEKPVTKSVSFREYVMRRRHKSYRFTLPALNGCLSGCRGVSHLFNDRNRPNGEFSSITEQLLHFYEATAKRRILLENERIYS